MARPTITRYKILECIPTFAYVSCGDILRMVNYLYPEDYYDHNDVSVHLYHLVRTGKITYKESTYKIGVDKRLNRRLYIRVNDLTDFFALLM